MALALVGRPKAYALLLGSGLSTAASIPTGWEIVRRLIGDLAVAAGDTAPDDPERWYLDRFGEDATYASVVERCARSADDRHALIGRFLDGDGDEPAIPTEAHKNIARLVANGLVSVIVTTNFDDLLEQALRAAGVRPVVIATADAATGALPLVHQDVLLLKLHGDRDDPRIKNTGAELDEYEPAMNRLLEQILDSYGLLVAGWSADHDGALRKAILGCPSRRFTTYWTRRSSLSTAARQVADAREAIEVEITDIQPFFAELTDAAISLQANRGPRGATLRADVESAKRELRGGQVAIALHDRLAAEFDRIRRHPIWSDPIFDGMERLPARAEEALAELGAVAALVGTTAYWGDEDTDKWWLPEIRRFGYRPNVSGMVALIDLVRLPAAVVLWAAGIAACANERFDLLARLTYEPELTNPYNDAPEPAISSLGPGTLHVGDGHARFFRLFRPALADLLGIGDAAFIDAWERWQYLQAIRCKDLAIVENKSSAADPPRLLVESRSNSCTAVAAEWFRQDSPRWAGTHGLVAAGAFGGDPERLDAARDLFDEQYVTHVKDADWGTLAGAGHGMLPSGRHYPGAYHSDAVLYFDPAGASPR